jgi:hypothetical protein
MKYLFLLHSPHGPSTDPDSAEYAENVSAYGAMQTPMIEARSAATWSSTAPTSTRR